MKDKSLKNIYTYDQVTHEYLVKIDLDNYRDVYSEWDYAPMVNRDLDDDLIEFLLESSYEIGLKRKMSIVFFIPKQLEDKKKEERTSLGMQHYFKYQIRRIKGQLMRQIKVSIFFLILGLLFLISATFIQQSFKNGFLMHTLTEGLYIGGWVALWEIFSIWFFQIAEHKRKIKHFKRLQASKLSYKPKK
jgi:hypothetical protein